MFYLRYRSWGQTRDCKGCRFWSEMVARAGGGMSVQAMCLCLSQNSPNHLRYTSGATSCGAWLPGDLGAIDSPGGDPYEDEEVV